MATLSGLQALVYVYLGTTSSDPAYPAATVTALLNAAAGRYVDDIHQARPDYLFTSTTLAASTPTTRIYTLPADFAGWLEVRATDADGVLMQEVRREELIAAGNAGIPAFAITGADGAAVLSTSTGVDAGISIYIVYRTTPAELSAADDIPSWMPARFHDLLAREAAVDGFGLGAESAPSRTFLQTLEDRRSQFWAAISRRGVAPTIQRA